MSEFWLSVLKGSEIELSEIIINDYNATLQIKSLTVAEQVLATAGREVAIDALLEIVESLLDPYRNEVYSISSINDTIYSIDFLYSDGLSFQDNKCGEDEITLASILEEMRPVFKDLLKKDVQKFNFLLATLGFIGLD